MILLESNGKICTLLQMDENQSIHSRKNPIRILPWSYKVVHAPSGLYAMGPLVGDNVIRVIPGGAIAIASDLYKQKIDFNFDGNSID